MIQLEYLVTGKTEVNVYIRIEAESEEDAMKKAYDEFSGISSYAGNGGTDKLIGVAMENESIDADGDVEFYQAEAI